MSKVIVTNIQVNCHHNYNECKSSVVTKEVCALESITMVNVSLKNSDCVQFRLGRSSYCSHATLPVRRRNVEVK